MIKPDHFTIIISAVVWLLLLICRNILFAKKKTKMIAYLFSFFGFYIAAYFLAFLEILLDINHFWDGALFGALLAFGVFVQFLIIEIAVKKSGKWQALQELVFQMLCFSLTSALLAG